MLSRRCSSLEYLDRASYRELPGSHRGEDIEYIFFRNPNMVEIGKDFLDCPSYLVAVVI